MDETDINCRTRPDEGLDAILRLQPGLFTGHPSEVFGSFIGGLVKVGYVPVRDIIALPYDWRLSPMKLQSRDRYFTVMRRMIELMVETHSSPSVPKEESRVTLVSHSLGSNVVRYFLEWLKDEIGSNHWQEWIDAHISTYVAVSAPLLGSPDTVKGVMSGHTFGALPVSMENCRRMGLSFGSSPWMLPINLEDVDPVASANFLAAVNRTSTLNTRWPANVLLEIDDASVAQNPQLGIWNNTMQCNLNDATGDRGRLFRTLAETFDSEFEPFSTKVDEYVDAGILKPWKERPPFDRVVFAIGTNMQTAISHRWRYRKDATPLRRWQHLERIYEEKGGRILRSREAAKAGIGESTGMLKSGDSVVPYLSLAYAHTWLPDMVNVTRVPQRLHSPEEVLSLDDIAPAEFHALFASSDSHDKASLASKMNSNASSASSSAKWNNSATTTTTSTTATATSRPTSSPTAPHAAASSAGTGARSSDLYDTFFEARWLNDVGRPMATYVWEVRCLRTHRSRVFAYSDCNDR